MLLAVGTPFLQRVDRRTTPYVSSSNICSSECNSVSRDCLDSLKMFGVFSSRGVAASISIANDRHGA